MKNDNSFNREDVLLLNTKQNEKPDHFFGRYHLHILCHEGTADFQLNGERFFIRKGDFVIWQLGSSVKDCHYSDDFDADFLCVSSPFLIAYNPEKVWATKAFVFIKKNPVYSLNEEMFGLLEHDFQEFRYRLNQTSHVFQKDVMGALLESFFFDLWNVYYPVLCEEQHLTNNTSDIFHRFMSLLSQHAYRERKITYYSDRLFVTPKYLSELSKKVSGKTASDWITGYCVQELQRLLRDPEMTLGEISDYMNFPNYPNFTKYVKTNLGVSPKEFRENV